MHDNKNKNKEGNAKMVIVKESFSQNMIGTIMNAAKNKKLLSITYYSNEKGLTERIVEPMDVVIRNGKKNLVGWCQLRNDWRTFRMDRINFIKMMMNEEFEIREDYKREDFEDAGTHTQSESYKMENPRAYSNDRSERSNDRSDRNDRSNDRTSSGAPMLNSRPNKEFAFNTDNIKTMSENKLNFSNDNVKEYSEDEDDLAL